MYTVLLATLACSTSTPGETGDSADTGDTGTTTPVSLDELLPVSIDHAWGCRWLYTVAELGELAVVADFTLPPEDELTHGPLSYDRALVAGETLQIGGGAGSGDLSVFDCSDVVETMQGVHVWTATAATLSIQANYVENRPDWTCDGTSDNPVYDVSLTITNGAFVDETGVEGELDAWGPLEVRVADYCGG
jgi:hypothetical protein